MARRFSRPTSIKVFSGFVAAGLPLVAPSVAWGHAYVMSPASRDTAIADLNARAHKTGPCGGSPRVGKPTKFAPGASVTVKVEETVDHRGCFQVAFSAANDANWQVLSQIDDPDNQAPMVYQMTVKLPNATCAACTLGIRQIMYGDACPQNPQDPADSPGGTYYSCADICIGDTCTDAPVNPGSSSSSSSGSASADAGATSSSGGTSDDDDDGQSSTSSGKSKSKKVASTQPESTSCSAGSKGTRIPLAVLGLAIVFAAARRRTARIRS